MLFPQGNNVLDQVAVYLDSAEPKEQQDPNWHVCAQFALLMSNPDDPTVYTSHSKPISVLFAAMFINITGLPSRNSAMDSNIDDSLIYSHHVPTLSCKPSLHC